MENKISYIISEDFIKLINKSENYIQLKKAIQLYDIYIKKQKIGHDILVENETMNMIVQNIFKSKQIIHDIIFDVDYIILINHLYYIGLNNNLDRILLNSLNKEICSSKKRTELLHSTINSINNSAIYRKCDKCDKIFIALKDFDYSNYKCDDCGRSEFSWFCVTCMVWTQRKITVAPNLNHISNDNHKKYSNIQIENIKKQIYNIEYEKIDLKYVLLCCYIRYDKIMQFFAPNYYIRELKERFVQEHNLFLKEKLEFESCSIFMPKSSVYCDDNKGICDFFNNGDICILKENIKRFYFF